MKNAGLKGLLIRLDKIGDLVSTIPCDEVIPSQVQCQWAISKGLSPVLECARPARQWAEFDKKFSWSQFFGFLHWVKQNKFDFAISFQAPWWVSFALWCAGIPKRFGVLSQWHHFLFLSHGLRQKRSRAVKHEADYNLDLVLDALAQLGLPAKNQIAPVLKLQAPNIWKKPAAFAKYFVVHPGMAGSARNWPQDHYIALVEKLFQTTDLQGVLTGTSADEPYLHQVKKHFESNPRFHVMQNKLQIKELIDCLDQSEFVVAPSTGVLHLGAALGKKVLGIYSPILVQHPTRWQARGNQVQVFVPQVNCPADKKCLGPQCPHFDCMTTITTDQVIASL